MTHTDRILVIVTNTDEFKNAGYRTGLWLSELTHFLDAVEDAGYNADIASPAGGKIPLDPESLIISDMAEMVGIGNAVLKRYEDRAFMDRLADTMDLSDIRVQDYDAIYLTGGHGVMFDYPDNERLIELIARFYDNGRVVSAVCHGPSGLLNVKLQNREYLLNNKNVTGFSWNEEKMAKRDHAVPFNLEEELQHRGASFSAAKLPFGGHVVEDDRLITGQNPKSAKQVGESVVKKLKSMR